MAKLLMSTLIALAISAAPAIACAYEEGASDATSEEAASTNNDSASTDASSAAVEIKYGLYAGATQTVHSNETPVITAADTACGLYAEAGATIIANALTVQTSGNLSAAVATSGNGGAISIANSSLETAGADSPLLFSAGTVEADNVTGTAGKPTIACVQGQGIILVSGSSLASTYAEGAKSPSVSNAVALYRTEDIDTTSSQSATALFQANGSTLKSAIDTGSFFYLTNTSATITLCNTDLEFNSEKAKLLVACGSDATSNLVPTASTSSEYGTAGKNGATVTFTALDQKLEGNLEVDSISSVDFFLLEGSKWIGASDITSNSAGADLASNIAVNIDATSGWTVAENSTVSTLNIEKGGSLVDEEGKAVTIVDADGNKLVDGASHVEVTVTDEFSTTVKTTGVNRLHTSTLDRSAFDAEFGTSTAFGSNGNDAAISEEERAAQFQAIVIEWFHSL